VNINNLIFFFFLGFVLFFQERCWPLMDGHRSGSNMLDSSHWLSI